MAPPSVVDTLNRTKMYSDYHSGLLLQAAILEFCQRGFYDKHLSELATIHRKKSRRLVEAMSRHFPPEASWTEPEGGYAFWVTLPEGVSSQALLNESALAGVLFTPGSHFFVSERGDHHLRLSISRAPLDRIDEGVKCLGEIVKRLYMASGAHFRRQSTKESLFHI